MRYRIIIWTYDGLVTKDHWENSLEAATRVFSDTNRHQNSGLILDYSDKTLIAEFHRNEIKTYDKGDRPNPCKKITILLLLALGYTLLGLFIL